MLLPAGLRGHSAPAISSALPAPLGGRGGALLLRGPGSLFLGLLVLPGLLPRRGVGPGGLLFPAAVPPLLLGGAAGLLQGCIILFIAAWVIQFMGNLIPAETVEHTVLLKFFMTTNPMSLLFGL